MSPLILTLILAFFILLIAFALLGLGWIVRGKSTLRPGGCGYDPTQEKDESCGNTQTCTLCKPENAENADDVSKK